MNLLVIIGFILLQYLAVLHCTYTALKPVIQQEIINLATDPIIEKFTFVDKTRFVLQLLNDGKKRYFFSRPRRFGKTVFLRTLEAIFDHHRNGEEIFKGTYISNSSYNWQKYPVMYFDLSAGSLETAFNYELLRFQEQEGISNIPKKCVFVSKNKMQKPPFEIQQFYETLCSAVEFGERRPVVILVDEYDHHILQNSNNPKDLEYATHFLRTFFTEMRRSTHQIKLAVVTGITRSAFLHIESIDGDFTDISDDRKYRMIAGVLEEELTQYFQPEIERLANRRKVDPEVIQKEVEDWYGGYSFTSGLEKVYNFKSITQYFNIEVPNIYWTKGGRATFFWDQLLRRPDDFCNLQGKIYSTLKYSGNINEAPAEILMYDATYLTIAEIDYNNNNGPYGLRVPNEEMNKAFFMDFITETKAKQVDNLEPYIEEMRQAITATLEPDFNTFITIADIAIRFWPFRFRFQEGYNLHLAALMCMAGLSARSHWNSELAIIDVLDSSSETILLFELKLDCHDFIEGWKHARRSVDSHLYKQRNVLAAGISFTSKRNDTIISGWRAELYASNGTLIKSYNHEEYK